MCGKTIYEEQLNGLKNELLIMCSTVESAIEKAIYALVNRDFEMSKQVIKNDASVDNLENEIEQKCLRILLLEHPFATDFRDISAILKMITDLERIGDHASDISEISLQIGPSEPINNFEKIKIMSTFAISMVKDSVLSYLNKDLSLATSLNKRDDRIDNLFDEIKNELVIVIQNDGKMANQAILLLLIAKYLERVGDHAVNIGEWVEYAIKGKHSQS